jgi:MoaA/NifB/PqqE/SkfB family radical SAM enzyme
MSVQRVLARRRPNVVALFAYSPCVSASPVKDIINMPGQNLGLAKIARFSRRFVTSFFSKGRFTPQAFPTLSIETTNICNSDCVFCANSVMKRKKVSIDMSLFKAIVDDFALSGGQSIDLTDTIGDPLLDKRIIERGKYVRRYPQFKTLGFVTTLQWLHRHDITQFIDTFTWIGVSITLSGRLSYQQFFGVDKYEQALTNLRKLLSLIKAEKSNFYVGISLKPTDEDEEDIIKHPDFREVNSLIGGGLEDQVRNRTFFVDDWQGAVKLPAYLRKRPLYPRAFRPCSMLYGHMMVYSNGKVSACSCRDFEASSDLILGNAGETGIMKLWIGDKLSSIRRNWRLKNQVPNICKTCRHYLY